MWGAQRCARQPQLPTDRVMHIRPTHPPSKTPQSKGPCSCLQLTYRIKSCLRAIHRHPHYSFLILFHQIFHFGCTPASIADIFPMSNNSCPSVMEAELFGLETTLLPKWLSSKHTLALEAPEMNYSDTLAYGQTTDQNLYDLGNMVLRALLPLRKLIL